MHNLTNKQLNALRWFMEGIENGYLGESFILNEVNTLGGSSVLIPQLRGRDVPEFVDMGTITALVADMVFIRVGAEYTVTRRAYEISSFDFGNPHPLPVTQFIKDTHRKIQTAFNREELKHVCFELGISPDWAFGDKTDWPFELLHYLYRQNRLAELVPILEAERPLVDWQRYPDNDGKI